MSSSALTSAPATEIPVRAATKPQASEDEVGPSRAMEIGLHALVGGLLIVSIIGIAYIYGFNLESGSLLDNISAAVRALGVDGGFFLGLYFSRRMWTRKKQGWWDGIVAFLSGVPWFVVAGLMAALSWFSNTLFVTNFQTIITQDLLNKAGFTSISPELANKAIGAIPLIIILLYSIVPRRAQVRIDTRTSEEIEEEARREAARIRAQNLVAAARAEGAGQRLRTVVGGLVGEAFNLEEAKKRDERLKQMRIALETAGYETSDLSDEQVEIQAVARGVWDQVGNKAIKAARSPAKRTGEPLQTPGASLPDGVSTMSPELEADETNTGAADVADAALEEGTMTPGELAAALGVARGTINYWMRPDFAGPTKIFEHEITTGPDGNKHIQSTVFLRLFRTQNPKKEPGAERSAKSVSRSSRGRMSVVLPPANGANHEHQSGTSDTDPLTLPKLENGEV